MSLPIRTTLEDIKAMCNYLVTKPTGATLAEAKVVVDKKCLDGRKLAALNFWGLIENDGNKMKITDRGRQIVKDSGSYQSKSLREVIRQVPPYFAVIERVAHNRIETFMATEVAAHWHEHFRNDAGESDRTLNDQAVCFLQIAQAADLGTLTLGRRGNPTRFDFIVDAVRTFVDGPNSNTQHSDSISDVIEANESPEIVGIGHEQKKIGNIPSDSNHVFITHGKNHKILDQVKELVAYGKFEPVVAKEHETAAKPVPKKVMEDMRKCRAAVIHVSSDTVLYDSDGKEVPQINGNVLIEIGAAMALYGEKFILLVQDGVSLPSNLQGLYECRYEGNELNMPATMKLLKALSEF